MTKETLRNLKVGCYITPSDINSKDEGAYVIINKLDDGSLVAVKTAIINSKNVDFWEDVYNERIDTRKVV
jgi:hypothetical protein